MSLREEILKVSKDLLIDDGFTHLSMRKIAARANVTATSIYLHFENKDDLLLALIEESIQNLKQELVAEIESSKDFETQLEDLANAYIRFALENPKEYEIIYMVRPEEMPRFPKEKFQQIRGAYRMLARVLGSEELEDGKQSEASMIGVYTLWAQLHGVVSVILNKRLDTRVDRHRFIRNAVEHIVQGFITRKTPA